MALFQKNGSLESEKIVGPGGKYERFLRVFQGDNAGPHIGSAFLNFVTSICSEKGWHWEPQAPQMPYVNNLDLAVFLALSK